MEQKDKKQLKVKLENDRRSVQEKIADLKELTQPIAPENAIGRISRMDAINNKSVNEASLRAAQEKLNKIEKALTVIDEVDFGICVKCGREIPIGRLMIMPQSTHCVECA